MNNFKNANFYLFSFNDKKYILDYINIFYSEISQNLYNEFADIEKKGLARYIADMRNESKGRNQKTIQFLYEQDIFFSKRIIQTARTYDEAFLTMAPIHECNLQCKYCFAKQGENYINEERFMSEEKLAEALEYLYFDYFREINEFRFDFVSGGEPLLGFENIQAVVKKCEEFRKRGKKTKFWLCTNYILTGDNYTRRFKNIWGLVVITSETHSLVEILKHHKGIGLKRVQMRIVRTTEVYGLNDITFCVYKNLYDELFAFFVNQFRKGNIEYVEMISNDNDYLGKIMRRIILRRIVTNRCQAGKNKVSLTANGQLFPCDSFVGEERYCIGNALKRERYNGVLEEIYVDSVSMCSQCWARYICGGDCYHNSFLMKQNVQDIDGMFCKLQKYLIEQTIVMYCQMNEIDSALFARLTRKIEISTREGVN